MFYMLCIRKRETVSYLQFVHDLDFEYKKEGNCMMPTVCSWSRMCASERRKLYITYSMFMFLILCIRKYQKEGNCIMHTLCLCSRLCASERGKMYHIYNICIFYRKEGTLRDIYVFITITGTISLLVDYTSPMISPAQLTVLRHWHGLLDIFMTEIYSS